MTTPHFDITTDLPLEPGTTLLEASAGTGKTWTIGALVTRYIVEGHARPDSLLVVSFGRAATRELRQRVREHLASAHRALTSRAESPVQTDPFTRFLLSASEDELALRELRVVDALANYDAATIVTTHEFCSLVLRSLGVAGDFDPHARLVEDLDDLVEEVVADLFLQRYASEEKAPFSAEEAHRLGRNGVEHAQARLTPDDGGVTIAGQRRDFAVAVQREAERRRRQRGLLSYDDLLFCLAKALEDVDSPAAVRMRERWRYVLVDEFQDTDSVQWNVLDRAFTGHATMVLIGDPKQAIYGFRGADVPTYLRAASEASSRKTLGTNWRSDPGLIDALHAWIGGAALGESDIRVHPVEAGQQEQQVVGLRAAAPVRLRQVLRSAPTGDGAASINVDIARARIACDLAADIAEALSSGATYRLANGEERPLEPGNIAVLMFSLRQVDQVVKELAKVGVPTVVASSTSVLTTPSAGDWSRLLDALNQPQRATALRSLALTPIIGSTAAEIDRDGDAATEAVADQVRGWLDLARTSGLAAVHEALLETGFAERVLGLVDGERRFTDFQHIGQVLHEVMQREGLGLVALADWLRTERRLAGRSRERARRLDTDSAAVQIATIHGSKGLQYPLVYLPFAFNRWIPDRSVNIYHADGQRCADIGGVPTPEVLKASAHEDAADELRLTYVALTRAQSQVVMWWAPTRDAGNSGLSRLLLGRDQGEAAVPDVVSVPSDAEAKERFARWQARGAIVHEVVGPRKAVALPQGSAPLAIGVRSFTRTIDEDWRRTSYSGLIRAAEGRRNSEPEMIGKTDESDLDGGQGSAALSEHRSMDLVSPMATLPAGAAFGSLVHEVLELADPQAADPLLEFTGLVKQRLGWWSVTVTEEELGSALVAVNDSPLGRLAEGMSLADFGRSDRLCELDFEIPLAGGDHPSSSTVFMRSVGDLMRTHLAVDDPLLSYAEKLKTADLGDQVLRGYLSGSIDVVLRVGAEQPRFVVVDYKTNLLPCFGELASAWDYRPEALTEAMLHSHYPLQAMLYSAVLHRYLRWRIPGYEPERHLGGVMYLYVRGMCGADTPSFDGAPAGVFGWRPPAAFVTGLSDLLAGVR